jgi:hypothetical protein
MAALPWLAVIDTAKVVWIAAEQPALFGEKSPMSLYARLDALKERHALLESRILDEDHRPQPDADEIFRLKAAKLQIKDEMERIRTSLD